MVSVFFLGPFNLHISRVLLASLLFFLMFYTLFSGLSFWGLLLGIFFMSLVIGIVWGNLERVCGQSVINMK